MKFWKRFFLIVLAIAAMSVCVQCYSDLPESHWASSDIQTMSDLGIIKGYPDHTFRPDGTLSKAEFLAMCIRLNGCMGGEKPTEISGVNWWKPFWDTAYNENWDLPFREDNINDPIHRGEMAALLYGAFRENLTLTAPIAQTEDFKKLTDMAFMVNDLPEDSRLQAYMDLTASGNWQRIYDGVEWAVGKGLLTGYPDKTFRVNQELTRAEATKVLNRVYMQKNLPADARLIVFSDSICIYQQDDDSGTVLNSVVPAAEAGKFRVKSSVAVRSELVQWSELRKTDYAPLGMGMQIMDANEQYFWGQCGFYSYDKDGIIKRITDMPIVDYGYDAADQSFVLISHPKDVRPTLPITGAYTPVGNQVLRCTESGNMTVLLDEITLASTPMGFGETGAYLTEIVHSSNKEVMVNASTIWGMADLHVYLLSIEDGTAKPVQTN